MKKLHTAIAAAVMAAATSLAASAYAQPAQANPQRADTAAAPSEMSEGEVRKIDKESRKLTLKHGEIKNLDMPAMTMVFQLKDAAALDALQVGNKVKFRAEKSDGAFVVTKIEAVK